jgi:anti-sigma regulatory factor (Ser/Thr protein kinase)
VRHLVERSAYDAGLYGVRLDDFVLAVHEAVTNAVRYGSAPWGVAMWSDSGVLNCEVTDRGPGIPKEILNGSGRAATRFAYGGRGLWLMNRLTDVMIQTGPEGTTIRLGMALPQSRTS